MLLPSETDLQCFVVSLGSSLMLTTWPWGRFYSITYTLRYGATQVCLTAQSRYTWLRFRGILLPDPWMKVSSSRDLGEGQCHLCPPGNRGFPSRWDPVTLPRHPACSPSAEGNSRAFTWRTLTRGLRGVFIPPFTEQTARMILFKWKIAFQLLHLLSP